MLVDLRHRRAAEQASNRQPVVDDECTTQKEQPSAYWLDVADGPPHPQQASRLDEGCGDGQHRDRQSHTQRKEHELQGRSEKATRRERAGHDCEEHGSWQLNDAAAYASPYAR